MTEVLQEVYQEEADGYCETYEDYYLHLISGLEPPKNSKVNL